MYLFNKVKGTSICTRCSINISELQPVPVDSMVDFCGEFYGTDIIIRCINRNNVLYREKKVKRNLVLQISIHLWCITVAFSKESLTNVLNAYFKKSINEVEALQYILEKKKQFLA